MRGDGQALHTGVHGGSRAPGILPRLGLFALVAILAAPGGQEGPKLRLFGPTSRIGSRLSKAGQFFPGGVISIARPVHTM